MSLNQHISQHGCGRLLIGRLFVYMQKISPLCKLWPMFVFFHIVLLPNYCLPNQTLWSCHSIFHQTQQSQGLLTYMCSMLAKRLLFFTWLNASRSKCQANWWCVLGNTILIAFLIARSPSVITKLGCFPFISFRNCSKSHIYVSSVSLVTKAVANTIVLLWWLTLENTTTWQLYLFFHISCIKC